MSILALTFLSHIEIYYYICKIRYNKCNFAILQRIIEAIAWNLAFGNW